ncbi:hypothetical protein GGR50DRAFT_7190 [Xylaria sp. CBS 124048]|nr:hypothetical protein GGR50DRAFT_7190 [Xylaria sp. CBS 124048]
MAQSTNSDSRERPSASKSFVYPPAFWDGLSKIPLTRSALRELERRTKRISHSHSRSHSHPHPHPHPHPHQQPQPRLSRQLITRRATQFAGIRRFARHGGPDLSDLRGCPSEPIIDIQPETSPGKTSRVQKRGSASSKSEPNPVKSKTASKAAKVKKPSQSDRAFERHRTDHQFCRPGVQYRDVGTDPPNLMPSKRSSKQ